MGCFFGCFRIKDDRGTRAHIVSDPMAPINRDTLRSKNCLSSLLLSEAKEGSPSDLKGGNLLESPLPDSNHKGLKDEAMFLKACGTIPETPKEIRKASKKLEGSQPQDGEKESTKFHSWLPNTSYKKLHLAKQHDQPPMPVNPCEEWEKDLESSDHSPKSCISDEPNTRRSNNTPSVSSRLPNKQGNKSVRFVCESDEAFFPSRSCSPENNSTQDLSKLELQDDFSVSKCLPYPTPLKLTNDMQTPGTVFPATVENMANGKTVRIRSQYVSSVLNPVATFSQWKVLKEEDSNNSGQLSNHVRDSLEQTPKLEDGVRETFDEKESKVHTSLSSWLKPPSSIQDGNKQMLGFGRRTPGDRPILGTVAAHWNEEEPSRISPKWWDGNGIPNSTNKYKEDQKVSWHATPFEERLEKALSEESCISQRKQTPGAPMVLDESEEIDSAASRFETLAHSKSVISF